MKKNLIFVGSIVVITIIAACQPSESLNTKTDTTRFRDLNHNGELDAYENTALSIDQRIDDLVSRMTLEEKVGSMLHGSLWGNNGPFSPTNTGYDFERAKKQIEQDRVTSFVTRLSIDPKLFAEQNNNIQRLAEASRLGIPVTISSDPRNHFQALAGISNDVAGFSQWPETLGLAAIDDPELIQTFGRIVAKEYRAVGIHMALSPQADLATEPRWQRAMGTFGSNPERVATLTKAYISGFQGSSEGLTRNGVATVVKHWVAFGAMPKGFDGLNYYGRQAEVTEESFKLHVAAFEGAFSAHSAGLMSAYAIVNGASVNGQPIEAVGAGFNKQLLSELLRGVKGFNGIIISDWGITSDCNKRCYAPTAENPQGFMDIGSPWGMEDKSEVERFAKGIEAGIDQFGGVENPAPILEAIRSGLIDESRIDESVRRIMRVKFSLGLFDNPYVDVDAAVDILTNPKTQRIAHIAQRKALVLLQNNEKILPLAKEKKIWAFGLAPDVLTAYGFIPVETPEQADVALVLADTPFELLHPYHFTGPVLREGRLDFRDGDAAYEALKTASGQVPVIFIIKLDRAAILTNIVDKAQAVIATFGASPAAIMDVLMGNVFPQGHLPFELPSSMQAVIEQNHALPDDSNNPLFRYNYGMKYSNN